MLQTKLIILSLKCTIADKRKLQGSIELNRFIVFRGNFAQGSGFFVNAGADVVMEGNKVADYVDAFSTTP